MIQIRPVTDLRNKFSELENIVLNEDVPVYLTKNGYGTMVLLSLSQYSELTDTIGSLLNEADRFAELHPDMKLSHEDVFGTLRKYINESK